MPKQLHAPSTVRTCRVCGCTDYDCTGCLERTGAPCTWVEQDLCSACKDDPPTAAEIQELRRRNARAQR